MKLTEIIQRLNELIELEGDQELFVGCPEGSESITGINPVYGYEDRFLHYVIEFDYRCP